MSIQQTFDYYAKYFDGMRDPLRYALRPEKRFNNVLILAHGDPDGIACSVALHEIFGDRIKNCECVYTLPHLIDTHTNTDPYDLILVVDLAINNRNPQMSLNFIEKNKPKLLWIDHHFIDNKLKDRLPPNVIIRIRDSCVTLMRELFPKQKYSKKIENLLELAHETDKGNVDNLFNNALKINLQAEETRREIWEYGIGIRNGELERYNLARIKEKAEKYKELIKNMKEAIKENTKFYDEEGIAIVDMRNFRDKTVDHTNLFFTLYDMGYPVVVRKYYEKQKRSSKRKPREYLNIARSPHKHINLVKCFGLRSGAPFRITIQNKWTDEEIINKIVDYQN